MNQYNDIRSADRSDLAAAQAAFFASGGRVEPLESFEFKPRPSRIEPTISQAERDRRAFVEKVRELAATMTKAEIVQALDVTDYKVYQTCQLHGITYQSHRGNKNRTRSAGSGHGGIDIEADTRMAERIRALAEVGLRKSQARNKVGLGWHVMERLVNTYSIEFAK